MLGDDVYPFGLFYMPPGLPGCGSVREAGDEWEGIKS